MKITVKTLTPPQAKHLMETAGDYLLFDLRPPAQFRQMHLPGAFCVPAGGLVHRLIQEQATRSTLIFLYCRVGLRSKAAAEELTVLGYTQAYDIGGIVNWPYPLVKG